MIEVGGIESLQLSSTLWSSILGRITYEHGDRNGTLVYGKPWGNLETGAPEEFGTPSGAVLARSA